LDDRDKKKTKKRRRSSSSSKELKQQKYRKSNEGKHIPTTEKAVDEDTPNQQSENSIKVELGDPKDVPVLGFLDNSTSDDNETKISEQPTHKDNDRSDSHSTSPKKRISEKKSKVHSKSRSESSQASVKRRKIDHDRKRGKKDSEKSHKKDKKHRRREKDKKGSHKNSREDERHRKKHSKSSHHK